ncbi:MAG: amino acid permease, partial [Sporolactobacillus laevolacticus]|nr:amino acid permease [Sporolactobacillus laevolacticus]
VVSIGVVVLRVKRPDIKRNFKVPFVYVIPFLAVLSCGFLMINLEAQTWIRFLIWFGIGLVIYLVYGYRHSVLGQSNNQQNE